MSIASQSLAVRHEAEISRTRFLLVFNRMLIYVVLVAIAVVISTLYRESADRGFQDLLRAQLYNVVNSLYHTMWAFPITLQLWRHPLFALRIVE